MDYDRLPNKVGFQESDSLDQAFVVERNETTIRNDLKTSVA